MQMGSCSLDSKDRNIPVNTLRPRCYFQETDMTKGNIQMGWLKEELREKKHRTPVNSEKLSKGKECSPKLSGSALNWERKPRASFNSPRDGGCPMFLAKLKEENEKSSA